MDPEQRLLEDKKLHVQGWQVAASFLAPVAVVVGVWLTIRGNLTAQARAAEAQAQVQAAQALAESGDAFCVEGLVETQPSPGPSPTPPIFGEPSPTPDLLYKTEFIFGDGFDFGEFCSRYVEQPPSLTVQRELIQQLVEHPRQSEQILAMWRAIYEAEGWIDEIERALRLSPRG